MAMKTVSAMVYGKEYSLACDAGQEQHLMQLVEQVNTRVDQLTQQVGRLQEPTMLLYAALMLADELADITKEHGKLANDVTRAKQQSETQGEARVAALEEGMAESLNALATRIEGIAAKLTA